jgi:hypothetical protein
MRSNLTSISAVAAALVGLAALSPALAGDSPHMMNVRMPDGSIAQIQYMGDVPPQVVVAPAPIQAVTPPFGPIAIDPGFVAMARISDMLNRQADMMLRQAAAMPALLQNGAAQMPPGMHVYSMSSTIGNNGVCMRSVQITYDGTAKPQMVSHTEGNCGPNQGGGRPTEMNVPAPVEPPAAQPRTYEVKAVTPSEKVAMAQPASWQQ